MLTPMSKSPGTKLKVIETLLLGANLITSKEGVRGVNFIKNKKIRIYSNTSQMYRYINDVIRNYSKIKINKTRMFYLKNYLMENILSRFFLTIKLYKNANIYK
jgi:predicted Fe-Mo cluster-binding NifX family protein